LKGKYKKKHKRMSSPETPIQPLANGAAPHGAAVNKGAKAKSDTTIHPEIEPSPKTERDAYHCKADGTPWWKITLEFGAVFIGLIVAIIYYCQLKTMQDQLLEARRYTILSERPWIGLDDEGGALQTEPLVFDKNGEGSVSYLTKVKNFGSFGAQNVEVVVMLVIPNYTIQSVESAEATICNAYIAPTLGFVLYPGKAKATYRSIAHGVTSSPNGVEDHGITTADLVGCIFFKDQFGCSYHTKFTYRLTDPATHGQFEFKPEPLGVIDSGIFQLVSSSMDSPPCDIRPH
jgi:hypothetical protein